MGKSKHKKRQESSKECENEMEPGALQDNVGASIATNHTDVEASSPVLCTDCAPVPSCAKCSRPLNLAANDDNTLKVLLGGGILLICCGCLCCIGIVLAIILVPLHIMGYEMTPQKEV